MDTVTVMAWVAGYERAWRAGDTTAVRDLFTEDAEYLTSPYDPAKVGHRAIEEFWTVDEGEQFTTDARPVAVQDRIAVVRVVVTYRRSHQRDHPQEYTDLWILQFAEEGSMPLVLLTTYANGVGEEIFFRGALYAALPSHQAATASTGIYALATTTTRNPSLVLAAVLMGSLFALQRRASGGLQAPLLTHLTWSTLMVRYLPPLFRSPHRR